jgi:hypothetical protein
MEWLNLRTSTLNAPEYVGCEPRARATWLSVSLWSALQENGGRVAGAKRWKDRQWQQTCGVSLREVNDADPLLTWDAEDLIVWNYPRDKQEVVSINREVGRLGGLASARARAEKARLLASVQADGSTENEPGGSNSVQPNGSTERNRKGIGKEGEWNAGARWSLPDSLNTSAFRERWICWRTHWADTFNHGNEMPEMTAYQQLQDLVKMGEQRAIAAINNSLSRGNFRSPEEPRNGASPAPQPARVGQNITEGAA